MVVGPGSRELSARKLDPQIPEALDRVILRCQERDPEARHRNAAELEAELAKLDENGEPLPVAWRFSRLQIVAATLVALMAVVGTWWLTRTPPPVEHEPVSVLIADFHNGANDPVFEGSLEQTLGIAMEGASFVNLYNRWVAARIGDQLQPGSELDESVARLVAIREGINVILAGSIEVDDSGYDISIRGLSPVDGEIIMEASEEAGSRDDVLQAVTVLATELRGELGDATLHRRARLSFL